MTLHNYKSTKRCVESNHSYNLLNSCVNISYQECTPDPIDLYNLLIIFLHAGWCYIIKMDSSLPDYISYRIVAVFSYEVWVFLVMIVLPIIYTTVFIYVRCKVSELLFKMYMHTLFFSYISFFSVSRWSFYTLHND